MIRRLAAVGLGLSLSAGGCVPKTSPSSPDAAPAAPAQAQDPLAPSAATPPAVAAQEQTAGATPAESSAEGQAPAGPETPQPTPRPEMQRPAQNSYKAGMKALADADLAAARSQFTQAIEKDPAAYQAHHALGLTLERLGNEEGALAAQQASLAVVPDYEPALAAWAVLEARRGNANAANQRLEQELPRASAPEVVLAAQAEVASIGGHSEQALELARRALRKNPKYVPAMLVIARDHYRTGRVALAERSLSAILGSQAGLPAPGEKRTAAAGEPRPFDERNGEARMLRALIYAEQGRDFEAAQDLRAAVQLRPDLAPAQAKLGTYLLRSGNAQEAVTHLELAVRYNPRDIGAKLLLGDAYRTVGRVQEAREQLEGVLAADPARVSAHYSLGLLFYANDVPNMNAVQRLEAALAHFNAYKAAEVRGGPTDVEHFIRSVDQLLATARAQASAGGE